MSLTALAKVTPKKIVSLTDAQKRPGVPDEVVAADLQDAATTKYKVARHVLMNPSVLRIRDRLKDRRVRAIRCMSCRRLREHPKPFLTKTWACGCGATKFVQSFPHEDEMQRALILYGQEIEERNLYAAISQEILNDHRIDYKEPGDTPGRVRIYSK
jgi:hypothetical protein